MPYQNLDDGLYLIEQLSEKNGIQIKHYGVLDVGNVLGNPHIDGSHPVVVHQTPPTIQAEFLGNTGQWNLVGKVIDTAGAKERIKIAARNPEYDLFGNNCEHFARYVSQGKRYSTQIFWSGAAVTALSLWAYYSSQD